MFINCNQFVSSNAKLKVYNTFPYLIRAVDVYFICEDKLLADDLLTPDQDGNSKMSLSIDGTNYPLKYGLPGDSPLNPIIYKKPIGISKITFPDINPHNPDPVTAFVGSSDGPLGADWVHGTNVDMGDYILIELSFEVIPSRTAKKIGFGLGGFGVDPNIQIGFGGYSNEFVLNSGVIVVDVSQKERYDFLYTSDIHSSATIGSGPFGYGETSFGGIIDGGSLEGYGGSA